MVCLRFVKVAVWGGPIESRCKDSAFYAYMQAREHKARAKIKKRKLFLKKEPPLVRVSRMEMRDEGLARCMHDSR